MNLENIVIVLDHPEEARNIGAACRAMANNDIGTLRIVGNKSDYNADEIQHIHVLAVHAGGIFDRAQFFNSITDATADCAICAGTTRRRGKKRGKLLLPEEFADIADDITSQNSAEKSHDDEDRAGKITKSARVAVVFGNERTGLTDEQLDQCNIGVTIPSSQEFGSLNLSHAVQIICYHLFRKSLAAQKITVRGYTPLALERIDRLVTGITDDLQEIGFFRMPGRESMENFWRSVLSRASLSEGEAQYLEKIFAKIAGLSNKNHLT